MKEFFNYLKSHYLKWTIAMMGSFVTYQLYEIVNDWKFMVAFLGGGLIMSILYMVDEANEV